MEQSKTNEKVWLENYYLEIPIFKEIWEGLEEDAKESVYKSKKLFDKYLAQRLGENTGKEYEHSTFSNYMIEAFADMFTEMYVDVSFKGVEYKVDSGWELKVVPKQYIPPKYKKFLKGEALKGEVLSKKLFNKAILILVASSYDIDYLLDRELGVL